MSDRGTSDCRMGDRGTSDCRIIQAENNTIEFSSLPAGKYQNKSD